MTRSKDPVPPGFRVIEGDILVPIDSPLGRPGAPPPPAVYQTDGFWPGGVVPFRFDQNVSTANQNLMLNAMAEWEAVANVDFRQRNGEAGFLHIQNSTVNNSEVGYKGREQVVNIVSWGSKYAMAHELGHALGFWHEQSRSNRDAFVEIHLENVDADKEHNFDKHDEADHYGPYDFDSVMHYGQFDFSNNGLRTIVVLPPNDVQWQENIGQSSHLSYWDRRVMSFLYPEVTWRFLESTGPSFPNGSFLSPYSQLADAIASVPEDGTIWIGPGTYSTGSGGTITKAMTISSAIGGAVIE